MFYFNVFKILGNVDCRRSFSEPFKEENHQEQTRISACCAFSK
jgi:hypothetical protein